MNATAADDFVVPWLLISLRRTREVPTDVAVNYVTKTVVECKIDSDHDSNEEETDQDSDDDHVETAPFVGGTGTGLLLNAIPHDDHRRSRPRSRRRKKRQFEAKLERVKQDILHIFPRFERVLSKDHGCFLMFMEDLRDAIFMPNEDDIIQ